jgi:hypothetical protein
MTDNEIIEPFAKQKEYMEAAISGRYTFILYGGAIGGGKTYGSLIILILLCNLYPGSKWIVVRKDMPTIERTVLPAWDKLRPTVGKNPVVKVDYSLKNYKFENGSEIMFFAENYHKDKDLNRWRGLECNGFNLEEINEMQEISLYKAIERAGRNIIDPMPDPLIIATCNPTNGWVKDLVHDPWKNGTLRDDWLYIPAKITDNPYHSDAYLQSLQSLPRYQRMVFVEGNWDVQIKTGGEFWKSFELDRHVEPVAVDTNKVIHVSVDNNVLPYIAISVWQIEDRAIYQVHEIAAKDPNNTASASAKKLVNWLRDIEFDGKVFLYGDQTATSRNTIDDNKKSFLDKFYEVLGGSYSTEKRIPSSNPPVAISGDFVNAIYSDQYQGVSITINEDCRVSINDYVHVKQDRDGGMLKKRITDAKTKASYEEHGHFSDTKRYFIVECFKDVFHQYKNRFNANTNVRTGGKTQFGQLQY